MTVAEHRRLRWRRLPRVPLLSRASLYFLLGLGAATAAVAGGLVLLVRASSPASGDDDIERYIPLAYGTTYIYTIAQEGSEARWKSLQVKGPSFVGLDVAGQHGWVLESRDYDESITPIGVPSTLYLLRDGDALYFAGTRFGRSFIAESPKRPVLTLPIQTGQRTEWRADDEVPAYFGMSNASETLGLETINVLGDDRQNCIHSRTETLFRDENDAEHTQTTEDWVCPGLGTVRTIEDAPTIGYHREETLAAFRGPEGSLGPPVGPIAVDRPTTAAPTPPLSWTIDRRTRSDLAPLAAGGLVYLAESDGTLTAIEESTGVIAWQVAVERPITIQPVLAADVVAVSDRTRVLWGFDRTNGLARWSLPLDDFPTNPPIAVDGTIVLAIESGEILGVDARSGGVSWRTRADGPVLGTPALVDGAVAIAYADGGLALLDPATGEVEWSRDLDGQPGNVAAGEGLVAVTVDQAEVQVFDASDGRLTFTATADERPISDPAIGDGAVYAVAGDVLSAVDIASGDRRWRAPAGRTSWAPMVVADEVHVITNTGTLVSVDATTGAAAETQQIVPGEPTDLIVIPTVEGSRILTGAGGDAPWIHTSYRSIAVTDGAARDAIRFDTRATPLDTGPLPRPAVIDAGTLVMGDDNVLRLLPPAGEARALYTAAGPSPFLLATGNTAVIEEGREVVAVGTDGAVRWRYDLGAELQVDVTIDNDALYALTADSRLVALDLATGRLLWEHAVTAPGLAPPVVDGEGGLLLSGGGLVTRLDAKTGVVAWAAPPDAFGRIVVVDGVVFYASLASTRPGLTALALDDGRELWSTSEGFGLTVAAGEGLAVAVTGESRLVAFELRDGAVRWSVPVTSEVLDDVVVRAGLVYIAETGRGEDIGQRGSLVRVLDAERGQLLGSIESPGTSFTPFLALVDAGDRLILPSFRLGVVLVEFIAERQGARAGQ